MAALMIGIASSFAQVYNVIVPLDYSNCQGTATDLVDVYVSIYDDANTEWAEPGVMVTVSVAVTDVNVPVPKIEAYCNTIHDFTPSFTVYYSANVVDYTVNPSIEHCTASGDDGPYDCHDFYSDDVEVVEILPD